MQVGHNLNIYNSYFSRKPKSLKRGKDHKKTGVKFFYTRWEKKKEENRCLCVIKGEEVDFSRMIGTKNDRNIKKMLSNIFFCLCRLLYYLNSQNL